ncbi:MAG: flippase-like domain-containing protein, partial [Bacteroidota bacterium]|nr:flippase-like domain-containing protein [Bacteroidota bacterium]
MRKKVFAVIQYLIFLGLGIFLTWWQFSKMTPAQYTHFMGSLRNANYLVIIPIVIMALLSHISRAMRWKIMMEPMGYKPGTSNTFYAIMCGYFANTFIPRAGEILRCTLLGKYEKIPVNKLIGTILVERIFDLFCYGIFIVLTILLQFSIVKDFVENKVLQISSKNAHIPWIKIISVILLVGAVIYLLVRWIFRKYAHHRHIIRIRGIHMGLKEGIMSILRLKRRGAFLFHTLFIWAMYVLEIYVGFNALSATSGMGMG